MVCSAHASRSPHTSGGDPAKHREKVPSIYVARYLAMVEWFDLTCGELLGFLGHEKLSENTIVVYVSDNGWIQSPDNPRFAPRSKQSPYDMGLRSPIMLRWSAKVAPASPSITVHSVDFMPTQLKACGIAVPYDCPGINLLNPTASATRDTILGECYNHDMVDCEAPAKSLRWR